MVLIALWYICVYMYLYMCTYIKRASGKIMKLSWCYKTRDWATKHCNKPPCLYPCGWHGKGIRKHRRTGIHKHSGCEKNTKNWRRTHCRNGLWSEANVCHVDLPCRPIARLQVPPQHPNKINYNEHVHIYIYTHTHPLHTSYNIYIYLLYIQLYNVHVYYRR